MATDPSPRRPFRSAPLDRAAGVENPLDAVLQPDPQNAQTAPTPPLTPVQIARRAHEEKSAGRFREWRPKFLAALAQSGVTLVACRAAGVHRMTAVRWRERSASFRRDWQLAEEDFLDTLEAALIVRGRRDSDQAAMFMLRAKRRKIYGDVVRQEHTVPGDLPLSGPFRFTLRIGAGSAPPEAIAGSNGHGPALPGVTGGNGDGAVEEA